MHMQPYYYSVRQVETCHQLGEVARCSSTTNGGPTARIITVNLDNLGMIQPNVVFTPDKRWNVLKHNPSLRVMRQDSYLKF